VCHKATLRSVVLVFTLASGLVLPAMAQTGARWRKVGSSAVELMLASPATGPVDKVWFDADGRLYTRARSGKVFQTLDFETWTPVSAVEPSEPIPGQPVRLPEQGARIIATPDSRLYT